MSYCRCTPDSDVYVYTDIQGGWTLHVANCKSIKGKRVKSVYGIKLPNGRTMTPMRKLRHKDAGKGFNVKTKEEMISLMLRLKKEGLRVPKHAIERLVEEIYE